jgi:hypothetical protein
VNIKLDNGEVKEFKKGTILSEIKEKLKIRGKNYYYFADFIEYNGEKALVDL